jgi:hypothetical protein
VRWSGWASPLAADYARTALAERAVDVVVWVTATDRAAVIGRLAQAASELYSAAQDAPEAQACSFLVWLTPACQQRTMVPGGGWRCSTTSPGPPTWTGCSRRTAPTGGPWSPPAVRTPP